ncbi:MAG: hypothetical protein ACRCZK_04540 [Oscillospiraceae bacterium]
MKIVLLESLSVDINKINNLSENFINLGHDFVYYFGDDKDESKIINIEMVNIIDNEVLAKVLKSKLIKGDGIDVL